MPVWSGPVWFSSSLQTTNFFVALHDGKRGLERSLEFSHKGTNPNQEGSTQVS